MSEPLLRARGVRYRYGAITAVHGVDLDVGEREAVCVIGPNGAGKTTLARVLGGLYRCSGGEVAFAGERLPRRPERAVSVGIASVLEGRRLFAEQSVRTNLEMGAYHARLPRAELERRIERIHALFPALAGRSTQSAGTLSGGEQQMVAIGRALMSEPRLLILDEPSMGLAPKIASEVFDALRLLLEEGTSILLVEQNAPLAFELADRAYLLRQGRVVVEGSTTEMRDDETVRAAYLGA